MRERTAETSRIFSVYLPVSLYERLLDKAGKGRLNTFIKGLIERELGDYEESLKQKLILAHKRVAKNQKSKKELAVWDEVVDDYINKNNGKN